MQPPTTISLESTHPTISTEINATPSTTTPDIEDLPDAPPLSIQYSQCRTMAVTCTTFSVNIYTFDNNKWTLRKEIDLTPFQDVEVSDVEDIQST